MIRDAIDNGAPNPRGHLLATISITFGVVSTVLIVARWVTRVTVNRSIGSDDYVITLAGVSVSERRWAKPSPAELMLSSSWQLL